MEKLTTLTIVTILVTDMANSQFSMAVHILTVLACGKDENVKSEYVARSVNTNPVVIRRVLGQLGQAGIVTSQTGAFGGTRLARAPEDISLCEIYKAVSCGEIFGLPRSPNRDCPIGANIEAVLCNLQKDIERTVGDKLRQYTLATILENVNLAKA